MVLNSNSVIKWAVVLVAWTLIVFAPALSGGLLEYDDAFYITQNPTIHELSWKGLGEIIADKEHRGGIFPLPMLSFALEYHFFGNDPLIYHIDNLILHALNALMVYALIYLISARIDLAFLTAVLFSIAPLRVESVVWAAERKDVLYTFFYLGALIMYVGAIKRKVLEKRFFAGACAFFVCALLSKPQAITLPLVIVAIDLLYGRKPLRAVVSGKWPFLLIAAVFFVFVVHPNTQLLTVTDPRIANSVEKMFFACYAGVIYCVKNFIPYKLSPLYPFPQKAGGNFTWMIYIAPLIVLATGYLVYKLFRKERFVIFGLAFFLINIIMPLRLIWYNWFIGEHYTYLPSIGLSLVLAYILCAVLERASRNMVRIGYILLSLYIVILSVVTHQYCGAWENDITLWSHAIKVDPKALRTSFAFWYRGAAYERNGDDVRALADLDQALKIYPGLVQAQKSRERIILRKDESHAGLEYRPAGSL